MLHKPVHILLLNEYFPPDTSATAKAAAQVAEFLAVNHRVTVLAGRRGSYDRWSGIRTTSCAAKSAAT